MDQIFDVMCMLCGRSVAQLQKKRLYRDRGARSIQKHGKDVRCGFCGGNLYLQPDETGILRHR
jgi:DNA-directed RNA polymerase subunit RPC12/RpoP